MFSIKREKNYGKKNAQHHQKKTEWDNKIDQMVEKKKLEVVDTFFSLDLFERQQTVFDIYCLYICLTGS